MKRDWITPAIFGVGTFFILIGALDGLRMIDISRNPTALSMIGLGLFMLGAARLRNRGSKLRRKP